MQTVLGATGAIGIEVAKNLPDYTDKIRLVSRHPKSVNPKDELLPADLTIATEVDQAVKGSDIVYLTAGLPYDHKIWEEKWPVIMANVLTACQKHGAKLVFFDNIYMYDRPELSNIKETAKINPPSRKGKVRARIAKKLLQANKTGQVQALIARCADYYGPAPSDNSLLSETVIKPLAAGKKTNWLGSLKYKHSFTFTPDAGRATALLGNTDSAYGQVWHLPTAKNPPTGRQWIEMAAAKLDQTPRYRAIPRAAILTLGIFVPLMRELGEMIYQYDRDYIFNSNKFESKFTFRPTSYETGLDQTIQSFLAK